ncbi:MAG: carbon monoxide dehydrogenase [Lachnospiraceae bacterium]|nr:carbon monoxide dehydrogenase [Lachnospiraceae bacterium]
MMKLYDDVIKEIFSLLQPYFSQRMEVSRRHSWKDAGKEHMILRNDMAYELGGGNLPALGSMMITMEESLVPEDEVLLYGKDLGEISADSVYARIALVRVKKDSLGEGNDLYQEIRRLEYVKYHLFPEGYMMRISAAGEREMVRIGRKALRKGLGFFQIGNMFLEAYHRNPRTEAVKLIFITDPKFPYQELETQMKKGEQITKAIDHILKDLAMDCNVCSLKQICDEVEGMKELHFGTVRK